MQITDIEAHLKEFKRSGDVWINKFLDKYILDYIPNKFYTDQAIKSYRTSINLDYHHNILIKNKLLDEDIVKNYIYCCMGYGNVLKEAIVPEMHDFQYKKKEYFKLAQEAYARGIDCCYGTKKNLIFPQEYFFLTLEQRNLLVREQVLSIDKKPKRIVILHTLKSPESHLYLDGLSFFANLYGFEIWDYRFGKYTLGNEFKLIKDRLKESCAITFIASKEYIDSGKNQGIIKDEMDTVEQMSNHDPSRIYFIDLCENDRKSRLDEFCIKIEKDSIENIFKDCNIKDIYECRRIRKENQA